MKQLGVSVLLLLSIVALSSQAQTAGVEDFLPEVQFSRAFEIFVNDFATQFNRVTVPANFCEDQVSLDAMPNHLFLGEDGEFKTDEQISAELFGALCVGELIVNQSQTPYEGVSFDDFFGLINGQNLLLANGLQLDGGKQPVRASLALTLFLGFGLQLNFADFEQLELIIGDNACDTMRHGAAFGETLEYRWLMSFMLFRDAATRAFCSERVAGSESDLIALARQGSVDASLALAALWLEDDRMSLTNQPALNERLSLRVLRYFGYPLVTQAALLANQMELFRS